MDGKQISVTIRFMLQRDLTAIIAIERNSFRCPWTKKDFWSMMQSANTICLVAEHDNLVVGYMVVLYANRYVELKSMAVDRDYRRCGIGSKFIKQLKDRLTTKRSLRIDVYVDEINLQAQLFLRKHGFVASKVLHNYYRDYERDAYYMRYPRVVPALIPQKQIV